MDKETIHKNFKKNHGESLSFPLQGDFFSFSLQLFKREFSREKENTLARKPPCQKRENTRRVSKLCVGTIPIRICTVHAGLLRIDTN